MASLNTTKIFGLSLTQLKQEMTHRGLPTHGDQPALAERLQHALETALSQQIATP